MGKKLTKKLLVFLTLMCMIIGMNVSVSAETGSTGNTKAISAAENPADGTLQVWLEYEDDNGNMETAQIRNTTQYRSTRSRVVLTHSVSPILMQGHRQQHRLLMKKSRKKKKDRTQIL